MTDKKSSFHFFDQNCVEQLQRFWAVESGRDGNEESKFASPGFDLRRRSRVLRLCLQSPAPMQVYSFQTGRGDVKSHGGWAGNQSRPGDTLQGKRMPGRRPPGVV
eukprot:GHVT01076754.1.p3 GENE.GHVT01076754.1~~GHVT01076754.1.p3  ORF type:complete len:105 (-),score=18.67 GHVT01076754.1:1191-1505(-)